MTKIEIIAIQGVLCQINASRAEPKPDWMSADMHQGQCAAYRAAAQLVEGLLEAATEEDD